MTRYQIKKCRRPSWACHACREGRGPWFVNRVQGSVIETSCIIEAPTHAQALEATIKLVEASGKKKQ